MLLDTVTFQDTIRENIYCVHALQFFIYIHSFLLVDSCWVGYCHLSCLNMLNVEQRLYGTPLHNYLFMGP